MEQKPMRGAEPLDPPTPEVAKLFLDEVRTVQERREDRIDRRAVAWRTLVAAVVTSTIITAYLFGIRTGDQAISPMLLFLILTGQITSGFGESGGLTWQSPRSKAVYWAYVIVVGATVFVSSMVLVMWPDGRPEWAFALPGVVMLVGFGAIGVAQLWASRGARPAVAPSPEPMPRATRVATAALGVLIGVVVAAIGTADALLSSLISLFAMMALVVWMLLWRSDFGPTALGRYWRWPQIAVFTLSAVVASGVLFFTSREVAPAWLPLICGVVMMLLYVGAAFLPGRSSAPRIPERAR